jgi:hypothetical protein
MDHHGFHMRPVAVACSDPAECFLVPLWGRPCQHRPHRREKSPQDRCSSSTHGIHLRLPIVVMREVLSIRSKSNTHSAMRNRALRRLVNTRLPQALRLLLTSSPRSLIAVSLQGTRDRSGCAACPRVAFQRGARSRGRARAGKISAQHTWKTQYSTSAAPAPNTPADQALLLAPLPFFFNWMSIYLYRFL